MTKEFDLLVFIGRFQPFHIEHQRVIETALEKSHHVLVLVGSAGKARSIRNPWTFEERAHMIQLTNVKDLARLTVQPIYDKTYKDAAWIKQVQDVVKQAQLAIANPGFGLNGTADVRTGLIGAAKDHTSYYLKLFPQWDSVNVSLKTQMHATNIREAYFDGHLQRWDVYGNVLPAAVADFLFTHEDHGGDTGGFNTRPEYAQLKKELNFVRDYKKSWAVAPYPVKHATVDAVIEQSGHVLLVRRKSEPGRGLWALPGGHLGEFEEQVVGMMRELREETKIKVSEDVLRRCIVAEKTFGDPHRSTLGRVITQAYHIKLRDDTKFPKVKGDDDAEIAAWMPVSELREDMFFDDHFHIINWFLGL